MTRAPVGVVVTDTGSSSTAACRETLAGFAELLDMMEPRPFAPRRSPA